MEKEHTYEFECSAKLEGTGYTVQLSGYIRRDNHNAAAAVAELLNKKPAKAALKVRLQDFYGGDIGEGLAIHKDLKARNVDMEADGLVASMGTVIMCAGKTVKATKRMKAMMHRASGKVEGNADELVEVAAELKSLEGQLVDILAERTGLTAEATREKFLVEGKDTWFTAEQLQELKLVDEVLGSTVRTVPMREVNKLTSANAMLARFAACYEEEQTPDTGTTKAMNKQLNAALGLDEGADEAAATAKAEMLVKENKELKAAATARDEADNKRELEAAIAQIDEALKHDRITKPVAESLKKDAEKAPAMVAKMVATLTAGQSGHKSLTSQLGDASQKEGRSSKSLEAVFEKRDQEGWDFTKWSKEDPKGLERLRENHKELYAELRNTLNKD